MYWSPSRVRRVITPARSEPPRGSESSWMTTMSPRRIWGRNSRLISSDARSRSIGATMPIETQYFPGSCRSSSSACFVERLVMGKGQSGAAVLRWEREPAESAVEDRVLEDDVVQTARRPTTEGWSRARPGPVRLNASTDSISALIGLLLVASAARCGSTEAVDGPRVIRTWLGRRPLGGCTCGCRVPR